MGLLERIAEARRGDTIRRADGPLDPADYWFNYGGYTYFGTPSTSQRNSETIEADFQGLVQQAYKQNGVIYACERARLSVFSEARFQFRQIRGGRPGDYFGNQDLAILERPWTNGTTGDLLTRMLQEADFAGNAFYTTRNGELRRMRPDWVTIVMGSHDDPNVTPADLDAELLAYAYWPGGHLSGRDPIVLMPDEVAHFAPTPDPMACYRGMSWLTPVVREIMSDGAATEHKLAFFRNGATPQVVVSFDKDMKEETFQRFVRKMNVDHQGASNAYRTMYLGGGADVTVVGADLKQLDFKATQGAGEALALDTPVPTPTGWTTMGEIEPGDRVLGRDGLPVSVVGVSPVHADRVCYRVTLKDRTSIVADAEHLWVAVDRNTAKRSESVYTTQQLYDIFTKPFPNGVGGHRLSLPASPVLDLPTVDLLVDPYVLGAWLGDGQTAGASICGADDDLAFIAAEIQSRGYTVTQWKTGEDKASVIGLPGGLLAALRALGVLGDKRIPDSYLRSSMAQRLDLLRGLMDTDGSVEHSGKGTCEISSKYESLARQCAELVRSLGYRATLSSKQDVRSRTGATWRVHFRVEQDRIPFLLPRKVDRCLVAGQPHVHSRSIVSIEPVESVPVCCIKVDAADSLFLAGEGFVPTHNTRIAAAAGVHPTIVGLSEGLSGSSLNAGNFNMARRLFAEGTLSTLWRNVAASLATIVPPPPGAELWCDTRDVPFLREDQKDAADIQREEAGTISSLINAGYTPDSVVSAVVAKDWTLLVHTGLYSVQLQPPGAGAMPGSPEAAALTTAPVSKPINGRPVSAAITAKTGV